MVKEIKLAILSGKVFFFFWGGKEIFAHSPIAKLDKESKLVLWDSVLLACLGKSW
jgi:hypothetical protein